MPAARMAVVKDSDGLLERRKSKGDRRVVRNGGSSDSVLKNLRWWSEQEWGPTSQGS